MKLFIIGGTGKTGRELIKQAMRDLREAILANLPDGFTETMSYGMIGYVVPHSLYPKGYHVDPKLPLPFMNLASQKNFIAVHHMGMVADKKVFDWFTKEYARQSKTRLDMGESCIRLKKIDEIPYKLFGELTSKISAQDWINIYESNVKR